MNSFNDLKIGDIIYEIIDNRFYRNTIIEIIPYSSHLNFRLQDQNGYKWNIGILNDTINNAIDYLSKFHLLIADKKVFYDLCRNDFVIYK